MEKLLVIIKGLFLTLHKGLNIKRSINNGSTGLMPPNCEREIGAFRMANVYLRFFDSV
jgi:hypothetical protein